MLASVARISFSSLNAGTMTEIFTGLLTMDTPAAHAPRQSDRTVGGLQKRIQIPISKLRLNNLRFEISNLRVETLTPFLHFGRGLRTINFVPRHPKKSPSPRAASPRTDPLKALKSSAQTPALTDDAHGIWLYRGNSLAATV